MDTFNFFRKKRILGFLKKFASSDVEKVGAKFRLHYSYCKALEGESAAYNALVRSPLAAATQKKDSKEALAKELKKIAHV